MEYIKRRIKYTHSIRLLNNIYLSLSLYYFATFSSFFITENIKSADRTQRIMNTLHTTVNGSLPQRNPPTLTRRLPKAVATNQPPIIAPLYFGGATFDTNDIPIGLSNNSPKVRTR